MHRKRRYFATVRLCLLRRTLVFGMMVQLIAVSYTYLKSDSMISLLDGPTITNDDQNTRLDRLDPIRHRLSRTNIPAHQRLYPPPRGKQRKLLRQMQQEFEMLGKSKELKPCRWDTDCFATSKKRFFLLGNFFTPPTKLFLRNPFYHDRYWCGERIPANGGTIQITWTTACTDPPRLFLIHPLSLLSLPRTDIPPVRLSFNDAFGNAGVTRSVKCSVPCQVGGVFDVLNTVNIHGTPFELTKSMEGPEYYSQTKVDPFGYINQRYYSVTSFRSEIPAPYYSQAEYNIQYPAVDFHKAIHGASFLANNCQSFSNREYWVESLKNTSFRVDSLSGCLHNANPPPGLDDLRNKTKVLQQYLFHLAFENQRAEDYITEKLWGTLASGTLPVYLGAPNIRDHVPPHSIIVVDDFDSPQSLAKYLQQVSENQSLYESYHTWRYQPLNTSFLQKYNFTNIHSHCRVCKWALTMQYGFHWDHHHQDMQDLYISKQICRNHQGLIIGHPFKETWFSSSSSSSQTPQQKQTISNVPIATESAIETCNIQDSSRHITIDNGVLRRTVYTQDGIIDMVIDPIVGSVPVGKDDNTTMKYYWLRLETPIRTTNVQWIDPKQVWLQDDRSRIILLTNMGWTEDSLHAISLNMPGTIEMAIPTTDTVRIRIITENVDHFHRGAYKRTNYYGQLMTEDFLQPLQVYHML